VGLKPISVANWLPSVLWHCWLVIWPVKIVLEMTYKVSSGMLGDNSFVKFGQTVWFRVETEPEAKFSTTPVRTTSEDRCWNGRQGLVIVSILISPNILIWSRLCVVHCWWQVVAVVLANALMHHIVACRLTLPSEELDGLQPALQLGVRRTSSCERWLEFTPSTFCDKNFSFFCVTKNFLLCKWESRGLTSHLTLCRSFLGQVKAL